MTTVLHLSSSARGAESATRSLGDALAAGLAGDDGTIVERHLTDAVPLLTDLCETMTDGSLCALGGLTPNPVMSALNYFPEDFGISKETSQ